MAFSFLRGDTYRHVLEKHYFNRQFVFVFDWMVCGIGTLLAYFLACSLQQVDFEPATLLKLEIVGLLSSACGFLLFRTYKNIVRHTSFQSLWRIAAALCLKTLCTAFSFAFWVGPLMSSSWAMVLGIDLMFSFCVMVFARLVVVIFFQFTFNSFVSARHKLLIYGADINATSLSSVFKLNMQSPYSLAGYLKFSKRGYTYSVGDLPVFVIHHEEDLQRLVQREQIEGILFVHQRDILAERNRLIPYCMAHHLQMFTVPPIGKWKSEMPQVRSLDISDLLGREEIRISTEKIAADLKDKVVLVTGAAGSIGSELCRQIAQFEVSALILFDNCETGVHNLRLELEENFPNLKLAPTVGDVRSRKRLEYIFGKYKPQIVFHAAAYKHVPLMELNPNEAFMVNVKGTRNVAHTALKFDAEKFVMVSTDKAV
ncbi:MAG: polysaccharide biosynthesis protein, partial [Bacteroidales bacterium]|nr:polysaccharide biosynthesis protein [Bacteroidales bacterium]